LLFSVFDVFIGNYFLLAVESVVNIWGICFYAL